MRPTSGGAVVSPVDDDDLVDDFGNPITADRDDVVDDDGQPITASGAGAPLATPNVPGLIASGSPNVHYHDQESHAGSRVLDALGSFGLGVLKGAKSTGTGILKVGRGAATGDFGPFDTPGVEEEIYGPLQPHGVGEHLGFLSEQIGEAFIPGSMVDKSVKLSRGASIGVRLGEAMFKEATTSAGTAFLQTGGDPKAAALAGATGGILRGTLSTPLFFRDAKMAQESMEMAERYGFPLLPHEQTQSSIWRFAHFLSSRSVGGAKTVAQFKVARNEMLEGIATNLAKGLDEAPMDPRSVGLYVQETLDQVDAAAGAKLREAADEILDKAGDAQLDLGKMAGESNQAPLEGIPSAARSYEPSSLVKVAREIIADRKMPELREFMGDSLGDTDSVQKAYKLLNRVAYPIDEAPVDPIARALDPSAVGEQTVRELDLATARELRTLLFDTTAFRDSDIGKAAIKRLRGALDDEIVATLNRNGLEEEAKAFKQASREYYETKKILESKVIERISKKGGVSGKEQTVSPEVVATVLRGSESETTALTLQKVLEPAQMTRVRSALLRQTIEDARHPKGFWSVEKFKSDIDSYGDSGGAATFGEDLYEELKEFAKAAERHGKITSTVVDYSTGETLPLLAQLRLQGAAAAGTGVMTGFITGSPKLGVGAAATMGAIELTGVGASRLVAELMTNDSGLLARLMLRRGFLTDMTKALARDPMSTVPKQLTARITAQIAKELSKEDPAKGGGSSGSADVKLELRPEDAGRPADSLVEQRAQQIIDRINIARGAGNEEQAKRLEAEYDRLMRGGGNGPSIPPPPELPPKF